MFSASDALALTHQAYYDQLNLKDAIDMTSEMIQHAASNGLLYVRVQPMVANGKLASLAEPMHKQVSLFVQDHFRCLGFHVNVSAHGLHISWGDQ